ncbi:MAG: hypothetical protein ACRC0V_13020, partial [Fusobacteriaceae bacterium]
VENPIEFIKEAKQINADFHRYKDILKFSEGIFQFVIDTKKAGHPLMTEYKMKIDGDYDIPIVSFWAAVGNHNPIKRIAEIRKQRDKMYDALMCLKNAIEYVDQEENTNYVISKQDIDLINSAVSDCL